MSVAEARRRCPSIVLVRWAVCEELGIALETIAPGHGPCCWMLQGWYRSSVGQVCHPAYPAILCPLLQRRGPDLLSGGLHLQTRIMIPAACLTTLPAPQECAGNQHLLPLQIRTKITQHMLEKRHSFCRPSLQRQGPDPLAGGLQADPSKNSCHVL